MKKLEKEDQYNSFRELILKAQNDLRTKLRASGEELTEEEFSKQSIEYNER